MYQNSIILFIWLSLFLISDAALPTKPKKSPKTEEILPEALLESPVFAGAPPTIQMPSTDAPLSHTDTSDVTIQDDKKDFKSGPAVEFKNQVTFQNVSDYSMTSQILGLPQPKLPSENVEIRQQPEKNKMPINLPKKATQNNHQSTNLNKEANKGAEPKQPNSNQQPTPKKTVANNNHMAQLSDEILSFFPDVEEYDLVSQILNKHINRFQKHDITFNTKKQQAIDKKQDKKTVQIKPTIPTQQPKKDPVKVPISQLDSSKLTKETINKDRQQPKQPSQPHQVPPKVTPKLVPTVRPLKPQPQDHTKPNTIQQSHPSPDKDAQPDQQFENQKNLVLTTCSIIIALIAILKCMQWSTSKKGYESKQQDDRVQFMGTGQETQLELQAEDKDEND